jgi:hypothetical protein
MSTDTAPRKADHAASTTPEPRGPVSGAEDHVVPGYPGDEEEGAWLPAVGEALMRRRLQEIGVSVDQEAGVLP